MKLRCKCHLSWLNAGHVKLVNALAVTNLFLIVPQNIVTNSYYLQLTVENPIMEFSYFLYGGQQK